MAKLGYDADVEKDSEDFHGSFTVLPPGWYQVVIVGSDIKATKNGTGKYLELTMETRQGESVKDRLNILNTSEVAQRIGRAALAKIAQVCGIKGVLKDSDELHGRPFEVKLEVEEFQSNTSGEMLKSNKVKDYRATSEAPVANEAPAAKTGW